MPQYSADELYINAGLSEEQRKFLKDFLNIYEKVQLDDDTLIDSLSTMYVAWINTQTIGKIVMIDNDVTCTLDELISENNSEGVEPLDEEIVDAICELEVDETVKFGHAMGTTIRRIQ